MKTSNLSWNELAVFICTKCGKDISKETLKEAGEPAENLKNFLKTELNNKGFKGKIRVMTSSCLGTCPTGEQAVGYISSSNPDDKGVWICHPENDKSQILQEILKK